MVRLDVADGRLHRREGGVVVGEVVGLGLLGRPGVLDRAVRREAGRQLDLPGRVGRHEPRELEGVLELLAGDVVGDAPQAAALVARRRGALAVPGERLDGGHLTGRDLPGLVEQVVAPPGGTGAHHELLADLGGVGVEDAERGEGLAVDHGREQVLGALAGRVRQVDVHVGLGLPVVGRAAGRPQVAVGGVGVTGEAADLARVLRGDLDGEVAVLLPGRGEGVAVVVEELLVVPEHVGGGVVAQAPDLVVDVARRDDRVVVALDDVGQQVGQVGGPVDLRAGGPGDVVVGREEDRVRPALARLVELGELLLERLAADGAVDLVDRDVDVRVRLLEGLGGGDARRVDPHRDRPTGVGLLGGVPTGVPVVATGGQEEQGRRRCGDGRGALRLPEKGTA